MRQGTSRGLRRLHYVVMVRMGFPVFALLLVVLRFGMLVLKNYAEMRLRLEALVDEWTPWPEARQPFRSPRRR